MSYFINSLAEKPKQVKEIVWRYWIFSFKKYITRGWWNSSPSTKNKKCPWWMDSNLSVRNSISKISNLGKELYTTSMIDFLFYLNNIFSEIFALNLATQISLHNVPFWWVHSQLNAQIIFSSCWCLSSRFHLKIGHNHMKIEINYQWKLCIKIWMVNFYKI